MFANEHFGGADRRILNYLLVSVHWEDSLTWPLLVLVAVARHFWPRSKRKGLSPQNLSGWQTVDTGYMKQPLALDLILADWRHCFIDQAGLELALDVDYECELVYPVPSLSYCNCGSG